MKVLIVGDIVPPIEESFSFDSDNGRIFDAILPIIKDTDISIANLEAPVVFGQQSPIKKNGPSLFTSEATIAFLKNTGFNVITLANNHFFDQGMKGVDDTIVSCKRNHLDYLGGGHDIAEARRYLIKEADGKRIAIINACENEFSIADTDHGGSNPLDLIHMQEDIVSARKVADYVLVIVHGGVELYQFPTPRMKRWYRHFIELGADAVVNHHQHCMNGYEVYNNKPIFYGLGNFYFPQKMSNKKLPNWGLGYIVVLSLHSGIDFEMIPYKQDTYGISLRNNKEFESEIEMLSVPISDDSILQRMFDEHVINREYYLKTCLSPSLFQGKWISKFAHHGFLGKLYNSSQVYKLRNLLNCESHYEQLQRLFILLSK